MSERTPPLLVTGANGHVGLELIRAIGDPEAVRAVVRSERAEVTLRELPDACRPEIRRADPTDAGALAEIAAGTSAWVHLVGILKETASARYEDAHERSATAVAAAAEKAGVARVVGVSILGADPGSPNACLASKGRAEEILLRGRSPATVLRVPMVLGPGEIAAAALRAKARAPFTVLVRGGATLEQPIDSRDLAAALRAAAADTGPESAILELAGPESLPHRELLERVAARLGTRPRVVPLPLALARLFAAAAARMADPPLTPAMLGVLEHDDRIDPAPACHRLGLALTPLDETLDRTFGPRAAGDDR